MAKRLTKRTMSLFESIKHIDELGDEYWTSRSLWKILEYTEYRNFLPVIEKAKIACLNSGQLIEDHFVEFHEMVGIGSGAERAVDSVKLSRYATHYEVGAKVRQTIKELGRLCEIDEPIRIVYFRGNKRCEEVREKWELLTTHCGRKTFVVTALQLGIPAEVIMKWTGHSNYSAMKPYIKIVDDLKARSMTKFDEL